MWDVEIAYICGPEVTSSVVDGFLAFSAVDMTSPSVVVIRVECHLHKVHPLQGFCAAVHKPS